MPPTSDRDTNFILGHVIPHLDWLIALVSFTNPLAGQVRREPVYNSSIMSRSSHPHNSTATATPVTGQYYFMLVTLFWKRYQKKHLMKSIETRCSLEVMSVKDIQSGQTKVGAATTLDVHLQY